MSQLINQRKTNADWQGYSHPYNWQHTGAILAIALLSALSLYQWKSTVILLKAKKQKELRVPSKGAKLECYPLYQ